MAVYAMKRVCIPPRSDSESYFGRWIVIIA